MKIQLAVVAVLIACSVAGCVPRHKFTMENARKIKTGMTEEEVIALIGEPTSISVNPMFTILTWSYINTITRQYQTVTLYSKDGKIVSQQEMSEQYTKELIKNTLPNGIYGLPQLPDTTKKQQ